MNDDERRLLVLEEINKLPGPKKPNGSRWTFVICPFHSERTPSGRVRHDANRPRSIGWFNCFGCGESMRWNDFAEAQNLEPFVQAQTAEVPEQRFDLQDENLLGNGKSTIQASSLHPEDYTLSPLDRKASKLLDLKSTHWRGFSFKFLRSLGSQLVHVVQVMKDSNREVDRYYIFLPVYIDGELRGYIKALPRKSKSGLGYLNAPGPWSRQCGLFPFDFAVDLMKSSDLTTMVLVEGPRDALRLLSMGIPAMAILGTQSWSTNKIRLMENAGVEKVVICSDGDDAGKKAAKLLFTGKRKTAGGETIDVAEPLKEVFKTTIFALWDYEVPEDFEDKAFDPGNMPMKLVDELRTLL